MARKLNELSLWELHLEILSGHASSREATAAVLERIDAVDDRIGAYLTVLHEDALRAASQIDHQIARGRKVEPLTGIPLAIKDIICTRGVRTTCASRILHNYIPPYDAYAIERLKEAGAVIVGKTNLDEFGMGSSTENSAFKLTRNPWDLERVPGGSSGGSAAAVAAHECLGALGSDTGGSVRLPAALCGIVGLKPTYGRVSRYGLIAYASSLDQIGPMGKTVRDVAALLQAIAGHDARDSTSADVPVPDYLAELERPIKGVKIGLPREYFGEGLDPEVRDKIMAAVATLQGLGCEAVDISLPHTDYAIACYYIIAPAEASSNLARYDGVRYGFRAEADGDLRQMYRQTRSKGFGQEVKRRIMIGTYALSAGYYDAYYLKAQKVRTLIRRDYEEAFKKVDFIISPTSPTPAFRLGEKMADPLTMYLSDIYTVTKNLAGIPALVVPCGFTRAGLPVGLQISGNYFDEAGVLRLGHAYEQAADYLKPPLPI